MLNVVLIGMSGCGKTIIGKLLSREMGRLFLDTDDLIKQMGYDIPTVFATQGEEAFRALEYEACQKALLHRHCIISTGGGVVTQPKTMELLRKNTVIVYIRRDVNNILAVASRKNRPLFTSDDAVKKLFESRKALYEQYAQETVDNNEGLYPCVQTLLSRLRSRGL